MVLVDTSVLIDFFKGRTTPQTLYLKKMDLQEIPFAIPALCCQEVLQGSRDEREYRFLANYLKTQDIIPIEVDTCFRAAEIFFKCRKKGLTIRSTIDCIVAQIALDGKFHLLHSDKDFEHIANLFDLKTVAF